MVVRDDVALLHREFLVEVLLEFLFLDFVVVSLLELETPCELFLRGEHLIERRLGKLGKVFELLRLTKNINRNKAASKPRLLKTLLPLSILNNRNTQLLHRYVPLNKLSHFDKNHAGQAHIKHVEEFSVSPFALQLVDFVVQASLYMLDFLLFRILLLLHFLYFFLHFLLSFLLLSFFHFLCFLPRIFFLLLFLLELVGKSEQIEVGIEFFDVGVEQVEAFLDNALLRINITSDQEASQAVFDFRVALPRNLLLSEEVGLFLFF